MANCTFLSPQWDKWPHLSMCLMAVNINSFVRCMFAASTCVSQGQILRSGLAPTASAEGPYVTHTRIINCITHTKTMCVCCAVSILVLTSIRTWRTKARSVPLIYAMFFPCLSLQGAAGLHNSNSSYSHSVLNISQTLTGQPGSTKTSCPKLSCIIP